LLHSIFGNPKSKEMLIKTADGYGRLIDKVEGGIFRYSTTAYWTEPHFEKLLRDQANLSIFFFNVYAYTKNKKYLDFANSLIKFSKNKLYNKKTGFFFNSQGADIVDNKGTILMTGEEFFPLGKKEREKAIKRLGYPPKIEKNIYFHTNSLIANALLYSYAFNNNEIDKKIALNLIEKIYKNGFSKRGVKYSPNINKYFLDTQVYYLEALLTAYQLTANEKYLNRAKKLTKILKNYYKSKKLKIYTDPNGEIPNINKISFIDTVFDLNYRLAKSLYKLYFFTYDEKYLKEANKIIKRLPNRPNLTTALAYYLYLKPPISILVVSSADKKEFLTKELFKILPYWTFVHFVDIQNKSKLKSLSYPQKENFYICNPNICFTSQKSYLKIEENIYKIFRKFYKD